MGRCGHKFLKMHKYSVILVILCLLISLLACGVMTPTGAPVDAPTDTSATPAISAPGSGPVTPTAPSLTLPDSSTSLPTHTPEPTQPPPSTVSVFTTHTVQPGDTLLGLAVAYGVPMAAIQLHNGMGESTVLLAGQTLTIPSSADWEGASRFWVVYVVKAGDSLAKIARTYGLEMEALLAANEPIDADRIQVGQALILPLDAPAVALAPTPAPTPTPTLTPLPPPTAISSATTPAEAPAASGAAADVPPGGDAPPPSDASPSGDVADWPREVVRLMNEARAQHDLPPLTYNETLAQAAQAHANDCIQRGWCGHTGSDGSNIKQRIIRAGYQPTGWAECWAWTMSPQHAMEVWMDETPPDDPHRRTILSTWLTEVGVGVAQPERGTYFIADFGRP